LKPLHPEERKTLRQTLTAYEEEPTFSNLRSLFLEARKSGFTGDVFEAAGWVRDHSLP
jgi:hypothetical protein